MHYLGSGRPLTSLTTWEEVEAAASGGLLGENQWCELKAMLPPSSKPTNLELARDLASLSVHGGVLIIGVTDRTFDVVGCEGDIDGLRSRISQVAAMNITPPLSPVIRDPILGPDQKVVLVVSVPPSSVAPHMVDDAYWGRSSDGKRKLSDPEVRSLMAARAASEVDFITRLTSMVGRDPLTDFTEGNPTGQGHIYLLAEPCAPMPPRPDNLDVRGLAFAGGQWQSQWHGTVSQCTSEAFDPEGQAFMSGRAVLPANYERSLCYYSVKDRDGSVEVVQGGATATLQTPRGETAHTILDQLVIIVTLQTLAIVRELSEQVGYMGQWRVGVHLTHLRGKRRNTSRLDNFPSFAADAYTQSILTSAMELGDDVEAVAERLLRGFKRGLGVDGWSLADILRGE